MKKPASCAGCPLYDDGRGEFVPDEVRAGSSVMIVGQNPGVDEAAQGRPFVGKTGLAMEKYLRDAGLTRDEVSVGNAIRCRWRGTNELPELRAVVTRDALGHCATHHLRVPEGTRLLIAQGDYAAMQLTGGPVGEWRGYLRPSLHRGLALPISEPWVPIRDDLPVLLTVHLARLFREPSLILPTRLDWAKIPRILSGKWPRKPPTFRLTAPEEWPEVFAFDTEWYKVKIDDKALQRLQQSYRTWDEMSAVLGALEPDEACAVSSLAETAQWNEVLAVLRGRAVSTVGSQVDEEVWSRAKRLLRSFERARGQVLHLRGETSGQGASGSAVNDRSLPRVEQVSGSPMSAVQYWLGALSRLEDSIERRHQVPRLVRYSASWGTGDGETCVVEARDHRRSRVIGRPRVMTQYAPADVNHLANLTGLDWRDSVWDHFTIEDAVWKHAVLWSDHQHDLNYLGSLYSSFNRWKHLGESDPILYSGLDAVGLYEVDQALEREMRSDPQSRQVWLDIDRPALRSFVTAQYRGLRVNPERVREVLSQADAIAQDATLRAQACAGWPISLASNPQVGHQLYAIEGHRARR